MMSLDEAIAELRRCDAESRLEAPEVRAAIANGVISGRLVPATALTEANATIARLEADVARLEGQYDALWKWHLVLIGERREERAALTPGKGEGE